MVNLLTSSTNSGTPKKQQPWVHDDQVCLIAMFFIRPIVSLPEANGFTLQFPFETLGGLLINSIYTPFLVQTQKHSLYDPRLGVKILQIKPCRPNHLSPVGPKKTRGQPWESPRVYTCFWIFLDLP